MRKILSVVLSFGLLFQQSGLVYAVGELNLANYLSQARNAIVQPDQFRPAQLRYISYDLKSNDFKLLLDKGDFLKGSPSHQVTRSQEKEDKIIQETTQELMRYFFIGLSLPNDKFWVNLRPDAADSIIDPLLEKTDIGKIFLESDLQLKKDTASFTSPQTTEGKIYWDKLYQKAGELFGTENITIPTITRPWIVPNEVIVRETDDSAYIYKATLKVMLEEDYLTSRGGSRTAPTPDQYTFSDPRLKELNQYSTQLIREAILPKLTQEVNSSQRYAKLRQVYYSLVLSRWFKMKYKGKPGQYPELIDRQNLTNLASKQAWDKQTYFSQYQESFANGEYKLKETVASVFGQSIRSYVSGGIVVGSPISEGVVKVSSPTVVTDKLIGDGNILFDKKLKVIKSSAQPAAIAASPIIVDKSDAGKLSAITLNSGLSVRLNGWGAETLREVLRGGQPVDIVVFPPELYRNGIEYGSPEFLVYYNLFFAPADNNAPINLSWRRGNYTFLVAQNKEQKEAIERIITRSFLGSPQEFYEGIMNGIINIKGISPEDIRSSDIIHFMQNRPMFPVVGENLKIGQFVKVHILDEEFDYKTKDGSNLKLRIERDNNGSYKIAETGNGQDAVYQNILADEYRPPVMQSIAVTNAQIDAHNFLNRPEFGYTILGDSHGFDPDGNNTSILVSVGGKYLLIDGSPATYQITKDLRIPSLEIEYIFLTHTHDDHDAILNRVLNGVPVKLIATPAVYANFVAKAKDKLKLYGQDINIDEWVDYIKILPGQKLSIFNGKAIIECPSFYNKHTVPTSAVKIGYVGQSGDVESGIAYTADTQFDPQLLQFVKESDVIFHDAGVLPLHPSPAGVDKQITDEQLRPKVILVHASNKDIIKAGKISLSKGDLLKSTSLIPADFSERAKNNDNIRECLAAVAYLRSLSPEALQALAKKTKVRNFPPGDKIVKQGETIQYFQPSRDVLYLIVSGEAKVNIGGKEIRLKPGMTFGEFSAVNPLQPRSVDVVAGDNGLVAISFSKATIVALIKDFPEVRESVDRIQHNLLYLERLSEIEKSPFNQLPIEVLYDLAEKLKVVEFEKGKDVLIEGEQSGSEGAYIITEGQVEVASKSGGKLKEIYNSSPDNVVGEGAFFDPEGKRNATVTTMAKVKALHIAFADFQKALEHHPSLKYKFYVLSANRRDENNNNGHHLREMVSTGSPITSDEFRKDMEEIRSYLIELDKIQISLPDKISSKEDISELLFQLISRVEEMQSEVSAGNVLLSIDDQKNLTVALDNIDSNIRSLILVDSTAEAVVQEQLYNHYNYIADALRTLNQLKKKLNPPSVGSPLNAEALEAKLVKLPKTENQLSDLIKIFSEVDKNAQLGPQTAVLIAEVLTDSTMTPFPGESPNVFLMRGAVMESVTTFFSSKKSYYLYSKDRFSIIEVLDKIKEGLLLEKSINIPGRKISEETKKYIIALIDLYIEAVDNAKNDIKKQGEAFAGSPLTAEQFKGQALKILKDLGDDFTKASTRMENISERKELIEYTKQIIYEIGRKIERAESGVENSLRVEKIYIKQTNQALEEGWGPKSIENLKKKVRMVSEEIQKYANDASDLGSAEHKLSNLIKALSSSSLTNIEAASSVIPGSDLKNGLGGIDLTDRMLKIKLERVGSFALSALALPEITNVEALDLDEEYARIQAMASVSIRPSDTRILEFAAACYYRGEFDQRLAQVSSCIKAAHLADEISGRDSSEALRLATMLPDALYGG